MSVELLTIGLVTGATYAVVGIGLALIYQLSGTINLAHGEIGAFGATVAAVLSVGYGWPLPVAVVLGALGGAALGAATELVVIKRLGDRSAVIVMVATLGVGQLAALLRVSLPEVGLLTAFPSMFGGSVAVGPVELTGPELGALAVALTMAGVVWWGMTRTTAGAVVRATAANSEATRLAGVNASLVSTAIWTAAGALAVIGTVAVVPVRGGTVTAVATIGPGLLLRGFAAASLGRLRSVPLTVVGGLALGVAEAVAVRWSSDPGTTNLVVFAAVLIGLAALPRDLSNDRPRAPGGLRPWTEWPPTLRVRIARFGPMAAGAVCLVALPYVVTSAGNTFQMARLVVVVLVVISATILAGWSGQLSLAQFTLAGIGAIVSARVVDHGLSWEASLVLGAAAAAAAAAVVAVPTSRLRGTLLGIATLGLAVMAPSWLFRQGVTGDAQVFEVPRVDFGLFELRPQRAYYFFVVAVAVVVVAAVSSIGRRATGRRWRALKDNERAAAAFGVSPWRTRMQAFVVGGAVAGLAGGLLAGLLVNFRRGEFGPELSIEAVVMAVVGGLGSIPGAVMGVLWVDGLPAFFSDLESLQLLVSGVGLLVLLVYFPDGLVSVARWGQKALAGPPAGEPGRVHPSTPRADAVALRVADSPLPSRSPRDAGVPDTALGLSEVVVRFGATAAVDHVTLDVPRGSVIGLIGPNGAGKSTLLGAVSGLAPAQGSVSIAGTDVSRWSPDRRARHGLARTFQDARLFPTMTVRDAVSVAAATGERSSVLLDAVMPRPLRRVEARIVARADDAIELTGLAPFADRSCAVLSTGTRRIVELAAVVAAGGSVLLLDEPTAGLAQREVEAFPPILRAVRDHLDATVVIVEHDVVMLSEVCDRLVCMQAGAVIADGDPDDVRSDPLVVESYLGPDVLAVRRTGATT